jgi:outer membrane protein assembly factor BamE
MPVPNMRAFLIPLLGATLLGGCALSRQSTDDFLGLITPYRIDIVQGNVVTKEQLAQLRPGMSRNQVRDVLGTPLLTDPFHANRWDYIFTIRRPGTPPQRRSVVVTFDGEQMKSVDAPELPSEDEFVASITGKKYEGKAPPLALTEAQIKALPVPAKPAASAAEPSGPVREYPPLESAS